MSDLSGSSAILVARYKPKPKHWSLDLARIGAPALLAAGLGMFLQMFVNNLTK